MRVFCGENMVYPACTIGTCKKKVTADNSLFYCATCQQQMNSCNYRYIAKAKFEGIGGNFVGTLYDETSAKLFGISGDDMHRLNYE
jgi:hypothetical protein